MRISFLDEAAARAAVAVLEKYGYQATPKGAAIETECSPLLAVPAVGRAVGLHQIEKVHIDSTWLEPRSGVASAAPM